MTVYGADRKISQPPTYLVVTRKALRWVLPHDRAYVERSKWCFSQTLSAHLILFGQTHRRKVWRQREDGVGHSVIQRLCKKAFNYHKVYNLKRLGARGSYGEEKLQVAPQADSDGIHISSLMHPFSVGDISLVSRYEE